MSWSDDDQVAYDCLMDRKVASKDEKPKKKKSINTSCTTENSLSQRRFVLHGLLHQMEPQR